MDKHPASSLKGFLVVCFGHCGARGFLEGERRLRAGVIYEVRTKMHLQSAIDFQQEFEKSGISHVVKQKKLTSSLFLSSQLQ